MHRLLARPVMRILEVILFLAVTACATAPKTTAEKQNLEASAQTTIQAMKSRDSSLEPLLMSSAGYAVFPEIGKAGMLVGGAHGRGVLFQRGYPIGYVQLNQASIGAQLGAQTFAELLVFKD